MSQELREAVIDVIKAQDKLLSIWVSCDNAGTASLTLEDVSILRELIARKLYPINAFQSLIRIDQSSALDTLLSVYLGRTINPDYGYGGFAFDMSGIISALVDMGGENALRKLVADDDFNRDMLNDIRFRRACSEALSIPLSALPPWLTA